MKGVPSHDSLSCVHYSQNFLLLACAAGTLLKKIPPGLIGNFTF